MLSSAGTTPTEYVLASSASPASSAGVRAKSPSTRSSTLWRGALAGRTRQNKLVHFTPPHPLRAGAYATVEITRAAPHHLVGQFVDLVSQPQHKRRIAVLAG